MANSRICSIEGCGKVVRAKELCRNHYDRLRKYGDPLAGATAWGVPLAFLENTVLTFDGDECLIWPFCRESKGYGRIYHNGKVRNVSRVVCEAEHGPPPTPKHEAAHSCGKGHEGCVTKRHLQWKTSKENQGDRLSHGTSNRGERCSNAKLTDAQVVAIRKMKGLRTRKEQAEIFGVSRGSIRDIHLRRTWKHI